MADKFQLKAIITGVDKLTPVLQGAQKKVLSMRKAILKSGFADFSLGDVLAGGAFAAPFIEASRAAIDFESAMADVRKVVDFPTPEAFKQMGEDIIEMSANMPMAAKDIAAIVAAGGQAGIASQDLKQFAEDAVKMGIAFDQSAEESGDMMAKWRTAFRLTQDEVVALADKINYLSNTGASSAQQISAIVTRIGPLGEVAGLASGEIAAMGATLAGMGISEEVAATGMKNFMLTLTSGNAATAKQAKIFKALRMDAESVAAAMQSDASGTILRVLDAIAHVDKTQQAAVLSSLFGRESIGAIAPLLTNTEVLRQNFERVGDAAQYAGSMQAEYDARSRTTANALQQLKNQTTALAISVGNVLLPPILDFTKAVTPLLSGLRDIIEENPWIIKGILGAATALIGLKTALFGVATVMKIVAMIMGGPWKFVIKALIVLVGALVANWKDFVEMLTNGMNAVKDFLRKPRHFFGGSDDDEPAKANGLGEGINSTAMNRDGLGEAPNIASGSQSVNGEIVVKLEGATQGTRVEKRNARGPVQVKTAVGYRSLAFEGGSD